MLWFICPKHKVSDIEMFKTSKDVEVIFPEQLSVHIENDKQIVYKDFNKVAYPKHVLFWQGCSTPYNSLLIANVFKLSGVKIINKIEETLLFADKTLTNQKVNEIGLNTIETMKVDIEQINSNIEFLINQIGFPMIVKSDVGSMGLGIYKVENKNELLNLIELIKLLDKKFYFHIEKFIDYDLDVRMYKYFNKYLLIKRVNSENFKGNVSQGASIEIVETNAEFKNIFAKISAKFESEILAIDILIKDDCYYICEINSSPGSKELQSKYKINLGDLILKGLNE